MEKRLLQNAAKEFTSFAKEFTSSESLPFARYPDTVESLRRRGYISKYGNKLFLNPAGFERAKQEAFNFVPDYIDAYSYGYVLENKGAIEKAKAVYWQEIKNDFSGSPYERLRILYAKEKDWHSAIGVCRQYLNLKKKHGIFTSKEKRMQDWIEKYESKLGDRKYSTHHQVLDSLLQSASEKAKQRFCQELPSYRTESPIPEWAKKGPRKCEHDIPELVEYWFHSDDQYLTPAQLRFYETWSDNWKNQIPLQLSGNHGYLLKYVFDCIVQTNRRNEAELRKLRKELKILCYVYKNESFPRSPGLMRYLRVFISDTYLLTQDYSQAVMYLDSRMYYRLSIKYHAGIPLSGDDLLSLSQRRNRKLIKENVDMARDYSEDIIRVFESQNEVDLLTLITEQGALHESSKKNLFAAALTDGNDECREVELDIYSYQNLGELQIIIDEWLKDVENKIREQMALPKIGEGWLSETLLFNIVKVNLEQLGYEVIHNAYPQFLDRQHIDIFIPELNLGIEYQGQQHYEPIDFFGGEEGLRKRQKLDERKRRVCERNGVTLVEFRYDDPLDENFVMNRINLCLKLQHT